MLVGKGRAAWGVKEEVFVEAVNKLVDDELPEEETVVPHIVVLDTIV